ncbi:hypothetical protein YC2023_073578 [Brassica napus]
MVSSSTAARSRLRDRPQFSPTFFHMLLMTVQLQETHTVSIVALMKGQGKIIACELHKERVKRLEQIIKSYQYPSLTFFHSLVALADVFIVADYISRVGATLLDPFCSGFGTIADPEHLLMVDPVEDNERVLHRFVDQDTKILQIVDRIQLFLKKLNEKPTGSGNKENKCD